MQINVGNVYMGLDIGTRYVPAFTHDLAHAYSHRNDKMYAEDEVYTNPQLNQFLAHIGKPGDLHT